MRFSRRNPYRYLLVFSAVTLIILVFQFASPPSSVNQPTIPEDRREIPTVRISPYEVTPIMQDEVLAATDSAAFFPVVKVVDGDTVRILRGGKHETIRVIGINTPETVDPRKGVECFGKEASLHAKELLGNASVRLQADPTQADQDRYNRSLRYLYMADGRLFNQVMIEDGYAYEYTYAAPYQFQQEFKQAEQRAREAKKGLWNDSTCKGLLKP